MLKDIFKNMWQWTVRDWTEGEWGGFAMGVAWFALVGVLVVMLLMTPWVICENMRETAACESSHCPTGMNPKMTRKDGCLCVVLPTEVK